MFVVLLCLCLAASVAARCECGYSVHSPGHESPLIFTDAIESDFTRTEKVGPEEGWVPQQFNVTAKDGRGQYGKMFLPDNVSTRQQGQDTTAEEAEGLQLVVEGQLKNGSVSGAEIDSDRLDLHWGSFRAGMKVTDVNGTCAAFFWYFNDTQEIDMEFLSREFKRDENYYPINLVVQTEQSKLAGYDASKTGHFKRINLGFDPAADFHEYRFDYSPEKVVFFADGKVLAEMGGAGMPSSGGHLILQHWSNGNPLWSGGPPEKDAVLKVRDVRAYFNSSEANTSAMKRTAGSCKGTEMVCEVKDVGGGSIHDNGDEAGNAGTGDEAGEENGGAKMVIVKVSPMTWTATLAAVVGGLLD